MPRIRKSRSAEKTITVSSRLARHQEVLEEDMDQSREIYKFETDPAYVRVGAGVTKNIGDYESLRLDVSISMPCYVEEVEEVFREIADQVSDKLTEEVDNWLGEENNNG